MIENSYEVIILYLLEIDYYWQGFLEQLKNECNPNLISHITQILSAKKTSFELHLETLTSIKGSVSKFFAKNEFRRKIIISKVFITANPYHLNNLTNLTKLLIQVENHTISFFKEYFGMLQYLKTKELLDRIIKEKEQEIDNLRELGA